MKSLKMLAPAALAAVALMAFAGASTASATVLCKNNASEESCSEKYPAGTAITASLVAGTKARIATEFKTIECSKASMAGKTTSEGGPISTISVPLTTYVFTECNCEVKVLKTGELEQHKVAFFFNGTTTARNAEITVTCSTIFGTVHCLYDTTNTHLGNTLGGNPAKISAGAITPRTPTNGLCSAEAELIAEYEITVPKPLYVTSG